MVNTLHANNMSAEIDLEATLKGKLEDALKMQGDKVVYTHTGQDVKHKLKDSLSKLSL